VHQIWQSQKVFSYIQVEDILQMNRIAKKANLIGCIHLNIRQSAQVFGSNKTDLKPKPNLHDFCSLKFYRYVYHFDTSGCFCGGTNKGKSSFLCMATTKRCQLLFLGTMIHLPTNSVYKFWTLTLTTITLINSATSINMRLHSTALSCFLRLLIHEWKQSHGCWPDVDQFHHKGVSVTMP
jgi:hypothetical protein